MTKREQGLLLIRTNALMECREMAVRYGEEHGVSVVDALLEQRREAKERGASEERLTIFDRTLDIEALDRSVTRGRDIGLI